MPNSSLVAWRAFSALSAIHFLIAASRISLLAIGERQREVAAVLEVRQRCSGAASTPGWPVVKTRSPSFVAVRRPLQVVRRLGRLVVLVEPEHRHVHVVARVGEVVRVAAEEAGLVLDAEHQADVACRPCRCRGGRRRRRRATPPACVTPGCGSPWIAWIAFWRAAAASCGVIAGVTAAVTFAVTSSMLWRTLSDMPGHLQLVGEGRRVEPVLDEVLLRRAQPLQRAEPDVVVGQHEAVRRHDRAGAAAEPDRGQLQVVQPRVGDVELVLRLDGGLRDAVVRPEPFVGAGTTPNAPTSTASARSGTMNLRVVMNTLG